MTWQRQTRIMSSSLFLLLLLQVCNTLPQNFAYYTHVLPQQQVVPQHIVPQTSNFVVLPPGVAQLSRLQQYAAAAGQSGSPLGQFVLVQRDEKPDEKPDEQGWTDWFVSFLPNVPVINPAPVETPEKPTATKPAEGVPAKLEELEPASPAAPVVPVAAPFNPLIPDSVAASPHQKFILGQPQFFGNYDGLQKLGVKNLGNKGVIPNFLLVRGNPGIPHLGGKPEPEKLQDRPGQGALNFQRYMSEHRQVASGAGQAAFDFHKFLAEQQRQVESEQGSVVVNADRRGVKDEGEESGNEEGENVEATNPHGPSVAQVKPQAIALAGPGGVAAAAPVGTALVGPGGLAVAAPSATAVAGPSGGAPPLVAPAQTVLAAYLKAHANRPYVTLSR